MTRDNEHNSLLDTEQAAQYLNLRPGTLRTWVWAGRGPRICRLGRAVRYRRVDLDAFIENGCDDFGRGGVR